MLTKFHDDWHRGSSNIKVWPQKFEGCSINITDGRDFMKCALEVDSDASMYMTSFIKTGSAIQKLIRGLLIQTHTHSQEDDLINLLSFIQNK
jgi:hypothetical protein